MKKFTVLLAGLLLIFAGCSDKAVDTNQSSLNLEDQFGGYTASSERIAFGDADILDEAEGNIDYDDPIMSLSSMDSLVIDPQVGYYHLRILWGQLRYDSTVTEPTTWDGSLTISRGGIRVTRLIHFEEGQDYILERTDRALLEWVSRTTVHNDGLAVDLFIPPILPVIDTIYMVGGNDDTTIVVDTIFPEPAPVTVNFETGPYSREFNISELAILDTIVFLEDSNAVAFHAFRLNRRPCPRGFMSGRWGVDEEGNGSFMGVWYSKNGRIDGYVKGHYGVNEEGENVFFGKWVSRNGNFEGFIKGYYRPHPDEHAHPFAFAHAGGWIKGHIFSRNGDEIGVLKGKYTQSNGIRGGFFQARWKLNCPDFKQDNEDDYNDDDSEGIDDDGF